MLDVFESTTLAILWEYQGDNILKFLYEHRQVTHNTAEAGHPHKRKNQSVQTDDDTAEARRHMERRAVVLDKLIEDLLPELLKALHEIPPRKALEQLFAEQNTQTRTLSEQQQEMLLLLQRVYSVSTTPDADNQSAVQSLAAKVEAIDVRLNGILDMLADVSKNTQDRDGQLTTVTNGIDRIRSRHEADGAAVSHLSECVNRMDSTLTEISSRACSTPKHFADAATETMDFSCDKAHQSYDSDGHVETTASSHTNSFSPDAALSSSEDHPAPPVDALSPDIPANSETESVESEATVERIHALTALKEPEPNTASASEAILRENSSTAANPKPRRFSIRKGLKRSSWFGKKPL
ncbi:hypothetical protein H4R20_007025 [Coemansia guatemalensis]|uniref:Uncharacterized protein n=1 Tax=Coemansia guatemalensis TaxID=2761395 RepID=A0A9W8HUP5_9FUNG|nr:hypothetical protein H4R20_007025 [Coemansia guatemalensis]